MSVHITIKSNEHVAHMKIQEIAKHVSCVVFDIEEPSKNIHLPLSQELKETITEILSLEIHNVFVFVVVNAESLFLSIIQI